MKVCLGVGGKGLNKTRYSENLKQTKKGLAAFHFLFRRDWGGDGIIICVRVCLGVGGVKVCLRAKVSVRKNARVFISKVFRVIWCEYTTVMV